MAPPDIRDWLRYTPGGNSRLTARHFFIEASSRRPLLAIKRFCMPGLKSMLFRLVKAACRESKRPFKLAAKTMTAIMSQKSSYRPL